MHRRALAQRFFPANISSYEEDHVALIDFEAKLRRTGTHGPKRAKHNWLVLPYHPHLRTSGVGLALAEF